MERQLQRREKSALEVVRNLLGIVADLDTAGAQLPELPEDQIRRPPRDLCN